MTIQGWHDGWITVQYSQTDDGDVNYDIRWYGLRKEMQAVMYKRDELGKKTYLRSRKVKDLEEGKSVCEKWESKRVKAGDSAGPHHDAENPDPDHMNDAVAVLVLPKTPALS